MDYSIHVNVWAVLRDRATARLHVEPGARCSSRLCTWVGYRVHSPDVAGGIYTILSSVELDVALELNSPGVEDVSTRVTLQLHSKQRQCNNRERRQSRKLPTK